MEKRATERQRMLVERLMALAHLNAQEVLTTEDIEEKLRRTLFGSISWSKDSEFDTRSVYWIDSKLEEEVCRLLHKKLKVPKEGIKHRVVNSALLLMLEYLEMVE